MTTEFREIDGSTHPQSFDPIHAFLGVDGRLTGLQDRAYVSSSLTGAQSVFERSAQSGWSLRAGNFTQVSIPELNNASSTDEEIEFMKYICLALGDGIFSVNLYNGIALDQQEVVDQLNIIAGNPRIEGEAMIQIRHDNRKLFINYLKYLRSQVEGDPRPIADQPEEIIGTVASFIYSLINIDSMLRDRANLTGEACQILASKFWGPVLGNRQPDQMDLNTWFRVIRLGIEGVSENWDLR